LQTFERREREAAAELAASTQRVAELSADLARQSACAEADAAQAAERVRTLENELLEAKVSD